MNYELPKDAPLTFADAQERVDKWIAQFEEGYFPSFIQLARLTEELGELARAVSYAEGAKKLKSTDVYEEVANVEEELGDLLLQVMMHAQIAEEEGAFTLDDVICGIRDKMIRRHPHVFGNAKVSGSEEVLLNWEQIKAMEKAGKRDPGEYLPEAFDESVKMIERAKKRKGYG